MYINTWFAMTPHCIQYESLMQLYSSLLVHRTNLISPLRLTDVHHLLLPPVKFRHWLRSIFCRSSQTLLPPAPPPPLVAVLVEFVTLGNRQRVSTPPLVTRTHPRTLISRRSQRCRLMVRILLSDTADPQKARLRLWRCGRDRAITSTLVSESAQQKL